MKPAPALPPGHAQFLLRLGLLYLAVTVVSGISPRHPIDWWLEHIIVVIGVAILFGTSRYFVFSKTSYLFAFSFLCLHALGAHYTYSEVPYRDWWAALVGSPGDAPDPSSRNHFDRAIHFLYGLLFARPFREAFYFALTPRRDFWSHFVVLSFVMASSLFYELLEWAAAVFYGGEDGLAFVGAQGDVWDAHKDMLLAVYGCLLGSAAMWLKLRLTGRDPARDWGERARERGGKA